MLMSPALNESPAAECFRRGNQRSQYLFFGGGGTSLLRPLVDETQVGK